jgi:hypothetical protein
MRAMHDACLDECNGGTPTSRGFDGSRGVRVRVRVDSDVHPHPQPFSLEEKGAVMHNNLRLARGVEFPSPLGRRWLFSMRETDEGCHATRGIFPAVQRGFVR